MRAAAPIFFLPALACLAMALTGCNREPYSRSGTGFSALDKKVLYDFRNLPPAPPAIDETTKAKVISAAMHAASVPNCRPESSAQIGGSADGSFTAAGLKQAVYLVEVGRCEREAEPVRRLVVFTAGAFTAKADVTWSDAILGTFDLNADHKNELLLGGGRVDQGQVIRIAKLVVFDKDRLATVEDFGQIYDDTCGTTLAAKSMTASVVYDLPPPPNQKPRFTVELYRAECPVQGRPPRWERVSGR